MNYKNLFFKAGNVGFVLNALLLFAVAGCAAPVVKVGAPVKKTQGKPENRDEHGTK